MRGIKREAEEVRRQKEKERKERVKGGERDAGN